MEVDIEKRRTKAKEIADQIASAPGQEPLRFARERCANDKELLNEVLELLGERSTRTSVGPVVSTRDSVANQKIGGYKTHWKLGGGGNGDVYLATRVKEPRQQVAMKLLRLQDGENDEFRRRFLRERQIVALLNHQYIVKLFDADRTKDGRPYFVMEYVDGKDIYKHANSNRMSVLQRLELFLKVCDAVQYLHSHLIVHRDLKPQNVLVDAQGNPRVLDFGIAKLLRPELMDGELITMMKPDPLTPPYASPEQWEGGLITSASDVYSLGVILFELLTGELPLRWTGDVYAYQRLVCEGSLPLSSKSVVAGHGALCREPSDAALAARLAGDLDAIISKALRKDVTDRYPTVAALVDDIQRYTQFLPVRARGEGAAYRVRRFLRRNRALVTSIAAIMLALATGLGIALHEEGIAKTQTILAKSATERANQVAQHYHELAQHNQEVAQGLQQLLDNTKTGAQQLQLAVQRAISDIKKINEQAETASQSGRGEGPSPSAARYALLGRNYGVLAQLLTLSGDSD